MIHDMSQGAFFVAGSAGLAGGGVGAEALSAADAGALAGGTSLGAFTGIVTGVGLAGAAGAGITEGAEGAC